MTSKVTTNESSFQKLDRVLCRLREQSGNSLEQGKHFERLVKYYFENHPQFRGVILDVYLWKDWQKLHGGNQQDTGIDIVVRALNKTNTGGGEELWAVQAKFYAPEYRIKKEDVDSFISEANTKEYDYKRLYVVSTTSRWSSKAKNQFNRQRIQPHFLGLKELTEGRVDLDAFENRLKRPLKPHKELRSHQSTAVDDVLKGFQTNSSGKLIMACGTGKTLTSLKIAERFVGKGGVVLFLVPSLSLLKQTVKEWTEQCEIKMSSYIVCSDKSTGRVEEDIYLHDLLLPATTDPEALALSLKFNIRHNNNDLNVVLSTYHSLDIVSKAQLNHGAPEFNLVICDEAHKTTGKRKENSTDNTGFVQIHDDNYINTKYKLFMTATPIIYSDKVKGKATENDMMLCSMDDENLYGPEFHRLDFSDAIEKNLLTDYKVVFLTLNESQVASYIQKHISEYEQIKISDAGRLIGCWNALAKRDILGDGQFDQDSKPMKRAVLFTNKIKHSVAIKKAFSAIIQHYTTLIDKKHNNDENDENDEYICNVEHVDGKMNAHERESHVSWLQNNKDSDNSCRILTNARCLTEGVDVPALDAIIFYNPRKSQVDVVQAVGRVMRKSENKKFGYVILPVVIKDGMDPNNAMQKSNFDVVWQVLQALRAHDDNFDAEINKLAFNGYKSDKFIFKHISTPAIENELVSDNRTAEQLELDLGIKEFRETIFAKIVNKCSTKRYWENWAKDVSEIANTHVNRIKGLLEKSNSKEKLEFDKFLNELQKNINPSIDDNEAIEMLSQHMITKPVFDTLFSNYTFTNNNSISTSMEQICNRLGTYNFDVENKSLIKFYKSVENRVKEINTLSGKQEIITELYESFFKTAFKKVSEKLGIVYTPIQLVDFVLKNVSILLKAEFDGTSLSDKNVHVLDPFTGTGTFITRLLQCEYIKNNDLIRKYDEELHANEIVLLAYYIAAVNIETAFTNINNGISKPFKGIVLTDTFEQYEKNESSQPVLFTNNTNRVNLQNEKKITIIVGNPPYSTGQRSQNDNNPNSRYFKLDKRIQETYIKYANPGNKVSIYDSYIRALRWASDRIDNEGIIAFVTNGSYIDSNAASGIRKTFANEFDKIYCINLRGDARTSGEVWKKEGGKIFESGSRTPIAITFLIKKQMKADKPEIHYYAVDDCQTRDMKLIFLDNSDINNIEWKTINPDERGDWINKVDQSFLSLIPLGIKKNTLNAKTMLQMYSCGIKTNRDAWAYNYSREKLVDNMNNMIQVYNKCCDIYKPQTTKKVKASEIIPPINDETKISWDTRLKSDMLNKKMASNVDGKHIRVVMYRPFVKKHIYLNRQLINSIHLMPNFFPDENTNNKMIVVQGKGSKNEFSALMVNKICDVSVLSACQCFPLLTFKDNDDLTTEKKSHNITKECMAMYNTEFNRKDINDEQIFHYIYGILHSPGYKEQYSKELKKLLPHIPLVKEYTDFEKYYLYGKELSELHLDYDLERKTEIKITTNGLFDNESSIEYLPQYDRNDGNIDKSKIILNKYMYIDEIPMSAYEYIVNGKSAIDWLMEKYQTNEYREANIKHLPIEFDSDPMYVPRVFKNVIDLSIKTMEIVEELRKIEI